MHVLGFFFEGEQGVFASATVGGKHPQLGMGLPPSLGSALASFLARCVDACQKVKKEIALLFGA